MKLTSFRLKDRVHIQDLDGVGLITRTWKRDCRPCFVTGSLKSGRASEIEPPLMVAS